MQIGIVGLPFTGKSTLFSTLLEHKSSDGGGKYKQDAERGIVVVPDDRLDKLTEMFVPEKQINATIEFVKVPGLDQESHKDTGLPSQFLSNIKTVDVILLLVRTFESELYPHPSDTIDPMRDIKFIQTEFILSDLSIIENRYEKLEKLIMKTQVDKDKRELAVLEKCRDFLEEERPLIQLDINESEELLIRGYQFLTLKPVLYVMNIPESDLSQTAKIISEMTQKLSPGSKIIALSAEIEKEIAQLEPEDAQVFLEDLSISEPATAKLINASYELLGVQSFFTVGEDECRAWTIRTGTIAQKAAGVIHSDLEKGFIRAEVVSYDKLMELGSMQNCKSKGELRLEGKEYIVKDGDIISVRFNV
jgi:GTP-binding protein YchF